MDKLQTPEAQRFVNTLLQFVAVLGSPQFSAALKDPANPNHAWARQVQGGVDSLVTNLEVVMASACEKFGTTNFELNIQDILGQVLLGGFSG